MSRAPGISGKAAKQSRQPVETVDLLTVREASSLLRVAPSTLYALLRAGTGPDHIRVGGSIRLTDTAIREYIARVD